MTSLPRLRATDRCDRCNAQAYVLWQNLATATLMFCAHHNAAHRPALILGGWVLVVDETAQLTPTA